MYKPAYIRNENAHSAITHSVLIILIVLNIKTFW